MNDVDNRGDIHGAVGSYVVHALDEPELSEFEAHLDGCESCTEEIRTFGETLAEMSAAFEVAPPPAVRASVLSAITGVTQLPAETDEPIQTRGSERAATMWAPRHAADDAVAEPAGRSAQVASTESDAVPLAPVASLADARRRRAPRALIAVAAAVALIAVAAGGWAINLNQRLQNQQAGQAAAQQLSQRETGLLRAPDAKIYTTTLNNGDAVSYVVSKKQNAALFIGGNVPSPGAGKAYQIWTVQNYGSKNQAFERDATFGTGDQQRVFLTTDVAKANLIAISIEPVGSQPSRPSTGPYATASI